jgi:hypothetical protein
MAIGPVQLLVLGFSQPDFHGEIIAELERLRESDLVQVIDSRGGVEAGDVMTVPVAGQLGHGITASVRRQPVRIVEGRREGGYRDAFEVFCCDCGDHPYWDYCEISLSLQRIRGPYTTMAAALAAYDQRLGLTTARRRS